MKDDKSLDNFSVHWKYTSNKKTHLKGLMSSYLCCLPAAAILAFQGMHVGKSTLPHHQVHLPLLVSPQSHAPDGKRLGSFKKIIIMQCHFQGIC